MDRVTISIQVQRQQTSELLQTINTDMDDVVEKKEIVNDYIYRYREHQFKCSLELGLEPKATLGWDVAFKETPATYKGVEVALVTVNAKPQGSPLAEFGISSAPCTVEIKRQPCYTLLCNAVQGLGTINSNPQNKRTKDLCFQVLVPPECLSSSGLLDGKLEGASCIRARLRSRCWRSPPPSLLSCWLTCSHS
ncbi:hypothetical protein OEZ86_002328 [Tetradesmus obliquus]|nr:hypothetical protein OEZ86_002328 [Tetradesmus obliquus]